MATTITTLGSFSGANSTDKTKRIPAALSALNKALAGDTSQLAYMQQQSQGSATAVGKEAFRRALDIYAHNQPVTAPAVSAVPLHLPVLLAAPHPTPVYTPPPPPAPTVSQPGAQGAPVGFDPGVIQHPATISVTGMAPHDVTHVAIGDSADGGVTTSAPTTDDYTAPAAPSVPLAPVLSTTNAVAAPSAASAAPSAPSNTMIALVLGAGVLLWLLAEKHRK